MINETPKIRAQARCAVSLTTSPVTRRFDKPTIGGLAAVSDAREPELSSQTLGRSAESEIVLNHRGRSDRHSAWIGQIKLAKDNLVAPDLAKEILEDVNR